MFKRDVVLVLAEFAAWRGRGRAQEERANEQYKAKSGEFQDMVTQVIPELR